ncbi:hypothetical protein G3A39_38440 [Paraburkholderia aspalathi]|nr:hypothetical protein [Paraburkholderia aspalathi]
MRMGEGTGVTLGALGLGAGVGALLGNGMLGIVNGMRERREKAEIEQYHAAVHEALGEADFLGDIALHLVSELAAERARTAVLERALEQRQAYIDRLRAA